MIFNKKAIKSFGENNRNMSTESPWLGVDEQQGRLQTYLDFQVVKRWVFNKSYLNGDKMTVLDVGSGKGRMSQCFALSCGFVISIEPFDDFYKILHRRFKHVSNVKCFNCTLTEYANPKHDKNKFDLIYISGVTPYFDDSELNAFFANAKKLLSPNGRLIVRELGSESKTVRLPSQVNRSRDHIIGFAGNAGFECVRWRRAYPPFLFNWLCSKFPGVLADHIRIFALNPLFYPVWDLIAQLNLPTRLKLPRGQTKDYYVYLFT